MSCNLDIWYINNNTKCECRVYNRVVTTETEKIRWTRIGRRWLVSRGCAWSLGKDHLCRRARASLLARLDGDQWWPYFDIRTTMSGLLYTLLGLAASTSLHCAVRREISPCTCRQEEFSSSVINPGQSAAAAAAAAVATATASNAGHHGGHGERIEVVCEKMDSFEQVAGALRGKFTAEQQITLRVAHSNLRDISRHDFKELRMSITKLELNHDRLGWVCKFTCIERDLYLVDLSVVE